MKFTEFEHELYQLANNARKYEVPIVGQELTNNLKRKVKIEFRLSPLEKLCYYYSSFYTSGIKFIVTNARISILRGDDLIDIDWVGIQNISYSNNIDSLIIQFGLDRILIKMQDCCDFKSSFKLDFAMLLDKFACTSKNQLTDDSNIGAQDVYKKKISARDLAERNDEFYESKIAPIQNLQRMGEYLQASAKAEEYIREYNKSDISNKNIVEILRYLSMCAQNLEAITSNCFHNNSTIQESDEIIEMVSVMLSILNKVEDDVSLLTDLSEEEVSEDYYLKAVASNLLGEDYLQYIDENGFDSLQHDLFAHADNIQEGIEFIHNRLTFLNIFRNDMLLWFNSRKALIQSNDEDDLQQCKYYALLDSKLTDDIWKKYLESLKWNKRKFLVVFKEISDRYSEDILTFQSDSVPSFLQFPLGHPVSNTLYTVHPYNHLLYVPFDESEFIFFKDKIEEFYLLLQGLGAEEIKVTTVKATTIHEVLHNEVDVSSEVGSTHVNGKLDVQVKSNHHNESSLDTEEYKRLSFEPKKRPYIREDLVWYHKDTKWQKLASMRLDGNLLEFKEIMSSREVSFVDKESEVNVVAEFNSLLAKGNGEVGVHLKNFLKSNNETQWKIDVKFRSLTLFEDCNEMLANDALLISERKYLDEFMFVCENGPEISDMDRGYLDRHRQRLGVSTKRCLEIESMYCHSKDYDAELEYLMEVRGAMIDGQIHELSIRNLERLKKQLGLSDAKAKEIENSLLRK